MGMFDAFLKSLDSTLEAVENGALEKGLNNMLDKMGASVDQVANSAEKIADLPQKSLDNLDKQQKLISKKITVVGDELRTHNTSDSSTSVD